MGYQARSNLDSSSWRTVPLGYSATRADIKAILKSALEQNVAFVPGDSFYANDGPNHDGGESATCA